MSEFADEVAREAGIKITDLKKTVENNKDVHISLLVDILHDMKEERHFIHKIIMTLIFVILLLIGGIILVSVHCQNILSQYEVTSETSVTTDNNSSNSGFINISR